MKRISSEELGRIAAAGEILARDDGFGFVRAVRDGDGRIWKQFRKKSFPSTAALRPYATRFVKSAKLLRQRGIDTVTVHEVYEVSDTGRHVVVYDELPGRSLRTALATEGVQTLSDFAQFMAMLHERGIYFRSMHMDNVLLLHSGTIALIDVTHVEFRRRPLNAWRRARNFKPITSYAEDCAMFERYGCRHFLEEYCAHAGLCGRRRARFLKYLRRLNRQFANAAMELQRDDVGGNVAAEVPDRPYNALQ